MSDLSVQLHEDARQSFEDQARRLLGHVVRFRDSRDRPKPAYSPDVFTAGPITAADIVGDPQLTLHWEDPDGKPTGIAVAEVGGLRRGLLGVGYADFETLVSAMARKRPFQSMASNQFLRDRLFAWVLERDRGQSSTAWIDFVLHALGAAAAEHRLLFPVSDLHVESPLVLGLVTLLTFPENIFEAFESRQPEGASSVEHVELCRSMRRDFQGSAVAETCVFGEPVKAQEIAAKRVELVVGVLRFFAPSHIVPGVTSRIARWGHAPARSDRVFFADLSGEFLRLSTQIVEQPAPLTLSDETRVMLLESGLAEVRDILTRDDDDRTDLETVLLGGMVTFGHAALNLDSRDRMIWYCAGLESVLIRNSSESIVRNLAERLAIFAYDTLDDRIVALKDIKRGYSLRSRFVHHGKEIAEEREVTKFARHGVRFFCRLAQNRECFSTKSALLEHVDRMKLSGGLPRSGAAKESG